MIDQNSIEDIIPAQDTTAMLRKLTDEEFQMLLAKQEQIVQDHNAKQLPKLEKLFPTLKMYRRETS